MRTLRQALRNLLRNGKRTAISGATVVFGTAMLVFVFALLDGSGRALVRNATELALGEVQVHAPGYREERSLYQAIESPERVVEAARSRGLAAAPRGLGHGLLSHGPRSAGVQVWGVHPEAERAVGRLPEHLARGEWLPREPARAVVIGGGLARSLGAEPGAEVVLVVQAADGSIGDALFRVAGVLSPVSDAVDRSAALVDLRDFGELFAAPGKVHEVVVSSANTRPDDEVAGAVREAAAGQDVRTWRELAPALANLVALWAVARWIIAAIFLVAAGLGVLNTMLMATYERIPEFGLVRALGATPWRVVGDVAAEAFLLGAIGSALGAALGAGAAWYAEVHGFDLSAVSSVNLTFGGVALDTVWRAWLQPSAVVQPVLAMWATAIAAALYPAARAARLDPVRALNHT